MAARAGASPRRAARTQQRAGREYSHAMNIHGELLALFCAMACGGLAGALAALTYWATQRPAAAIVALVGLAAQGVLFVAASDYFARVGSSPLGFTILLGTSVVGLVGLVGGFLRPRRTPTFDELESDDE